MPANKINRDFSDLEKASLVGLCSLLPVRSGALLLENTLVSDFVALDLSKLLDLSSWSTVKLSSLSLVHRLNCRAVERGQSVSYGCYQCEVVKEQRFDGPDWSACHVPFAPSSSRKRILAVSCAKRTAENRYNTNHSTLSICTVLSIPYPPT
jgi:hypothetical protein